MTDLIDCGPPSPTAPEETPPHAITLREAVDAAVLNAESRHGVRLRPYQIDAVTRVVDEITAGHLRILLVAPTGSGKTVTFATIAAAYHAMGKRVLVVTHRKEIIDQSVAKLIASGIDDVGVYRGERETTNRTARVQVASIQSLKPGLIEADLVIPDECHHCPAESWSRLLEMYPSAVHVGPTATPWWGDAKGLGDYFQTVVIAATIRELTDLGYLAPTRVFTHPHTLNDLDLRGVKTSGGDYTVASVSERVDRPKLLGNLVGHWKTHAGGARTLCFGASVGHSRHIVEQFLAAGVAAEHIDGDTAETDRSDILGRLRSGETLVVSNYDVLTEGVDVAEVGCVILARPTQRLRIYLQAVGRGMRTADGKTSLIVLDHAGLCLRHGLPDAERVVSLSGLERRVGEARASVRYCPKCGVFVKAGVKTCPECEVTLRGIVATEEPTGILVEATSDGERAVLLTLNGRTMTVAAWARELGISQVTIHSRLRRGADEKNALAPPRPFSPVTTITSGGRAQTLNAWARETGMSPGTIRRRLELGYTPEEALLPSSKELNQEVRKASLQANRVKRLEATESKTIGQRVTQERCRRRWTIEDLARQAKVSENTVSDVERGVRKMSPIILAKLEDALNIDLEGRAKPTTLGDKIADARIHRGWTIADLARYADVSKDVIRAIERGWSESTIPTVMKLLDALGVEPPEAQAAHCECGYTPAVGEVMYAAVACSTNAAGRRWGTYLRATHVVDRKPCPHLMESVTGNMDAAIAADRFKGLRVMEVDDA